MISEAEAQAKIKAILKAELRRRSVAYADLAERLTNAGSPISTAALANKLSRGGFSAAFLVQVLGALECRVLRLED